jgi:hypothetical protein
MLWHQHLSFSLKLLDKFTSNMVCSILVTVTLQFAHIISIGPFKGGQQALSEEKKYKKTISIGKLYNYWGKLKLG